MSEPEKPPAGEPAAEPPPEAGAPPPRAAPPEAGPVHFVAVAGRWLALLGTVIATGQAGTAWLHGYWQAEAEKQKSDHDLALADLNSKTQLAQQYLQLILDKNTTKEDRAFLLTALGQIDGHPLQKWAQDQYQEYQKNREKLFEAYKAQAGAAQLNESASRQTAVLSADIEVLTEKLVIARDEPEERQKIQDELVQKSADLGRAKAALSIAQIKVEQTNNAIDRSQWGFTGISDKAGFDTAEAITTISGKVTVSLLKDVFPASAAKSIEVATPYLQAALQEFKVSDKRIVAAIIATVAVETGTFEAKEAVARESGPDNANAGDAEKYRGRGYLQLTGRGNYQAMSLRLGLGARLLDFPEDAKSPEVACRVLVAWFADRQSELSPALANGDLGAARRAVAGTPTAGLEKFTRVYQKVLAEL